MARQKMTTQRGLPCVQSGHQHSSKQTANFHADTKIGLNRQNETALGSGAGREQSQT
jgi:hypothetical protein